MTDRELADGKIEGLISPLMVKVMLGWTGFMVIWMIGMFITYL